MNQTRPSDFPYLSIFPWLSLTVSVSSHQQSIASPNIRCIGRLHKPTPQFLDLTEALYAMNGKWWIELPTHPNTATPVSNKKAWNLIRYGWNGYTCVAFLRHGESPIYSFSLCLYDILGTGIVEVREKHSNIDAKQKSSAAKLGPFEPTTLLDLHSTIPGLESRKFVFKMSDMWRNYSIESLYWINWCYNWILSIISLNTDLLSWLSILDFRWKTKGSTIPSPCLASPSGICSRSLCRTTGVFLHLSMSVQASSSWPESPC